VPRFFEEVSSMTRTWKPTTAGIVSIIAGVMEIGGGAFLVGMKAMGLGTFGIPTMPIPGMMDMIGTAITAAGVVLIVFGILAIIGGVFSIKRRNWGLALTGSILSLPILPLGILAIVFVALGRKEFS
jgi:hypothetical protein